jgi:3-deoxy-7-phosphoheptulonate synthase
MLVVMRYDATDRQIQGVVQAITELGCEARQLHSAQGTTVNVVGNDERIDSARLASLDGVRDIIHLSQPYQQASRDWHPVDTVITLPNGLEIGSDAIAIAAGPCSVESEQQILEVAHAVQEAGATLLRGGAFKPRTSPHSFQGLGARALEYLARAREATGLAVVTEAVDPETVDAVAEHSDIVQIGARNMQNFSLLKRIGRIKNPVLLKRGIAATITELLSSAEYILTEGNANVILCERGIRSFDPGTRNLLDLSAIPRMQQASHLPVMVDPSHGTGIRDLVTPMALAAIAAGADGVMVEVHPDPEEALSDGVQSLYPEQFAEMVRRARQVASAVGRRIASPAPAKLGS